MTAQEHATVADFPFSKRMHRTSDQPISELMQIALERPGLISLAAGFVDFETLPADATRQIADDILSDPIRAKQALQYGTTHGLPELREALYNHLAKLDGLSPEQYPGCAHDMVVTTGSQQILHILADLLIDPDDIVIACWPSYFVFTGALDTFGAQVHAVEMDEHGIIPEQLEATLAALEAEGQLHRVKMVYLVPYHQNPTGITLAPDRRQTVLDIVKKYSKEQRILLLEDAAYRELDYAPQAQDAIDASIKSLDTDNEYVAYLGTFSKPYAPGLKTGYGLVPSPFIDPIILNKGGRDFGTANLLQCILADAMASGAYDQHVQKLCEAYGKKLDATLEALEEAFADVADVHWTQPTGGLYVWLTLPEHVNTSKEGTLFHAAIEEGMLFVPGVYCYPNDARRDIPKNTIRLSFGVANEAQIRQGVQHLAKAVKQVIGQ